MVRIDNVVLCGYRVIGIGKGKIFSHGSSLAARAQANPLTLIDRTV